MCCRATTDTVKLANMHEDLFNQLHSADQVRRGHTPHGGPSHCTHAAGLLWPRSPCLFPPVHIPSMLAHATRKNASATSSLSYTHARLPLPPLPMQMAVDKLKEGIDGFAADQRKLEELLAGLASGMVKANH